MPKKPAIAKEIKPEKAVISNQFPPRVIELARWREKTPFHFWFEEDHKVLAIQWTDFSKDRYPAE